MDLTEAVKSKNQFLSLYLPLEGLGLLGIQPDWWGGQSHGSSHYSWCSVFFLRCSFELRSDWFRQNCDFWKEAFVKSLILQSPIFQSRIWLDVRFQTNCGSGKHFGQRCKTERLKVGAADYFGSLVLITLSSHFFHSCSFSALGILSQKLWIFF